MIEEYKNVYLQNEYQINETVSKATRFLFYFELCMYVLCLMKVFNISIAIMNLAIVTLLIPLLLPTLLVDILHLEKPWVKYCIITCSIMVTGICYILFTFQTILLYVIPTLLAALYLERKLLKFTCIGTIINIALSHIVTCFVLLQPWIEPFTEPKLILWYGAIPRVLFYLCCAASIFLLNSKYEKLVVGFYSLLLNNENNQKEVTTNDIHKIAAEQKDIVKSMTQREQEIFHLMIQGYTNAQIANKLNLSMGTVKNYVSVIYDKTEIRERTALVIKYNGIFKQYD